jgi:hypothetical protein
VMSMVGVIDTAGNVSKGIVTTTSDFARGAKFDGKSRWYRYLAWSDPCPLFQLFQRVFAIACGYADCNDAARLAEDTIQKLLVGRDPVAGEALASQPTLSRMLRTELEASAPRSICSSCDR